MSLLTGPDVSFTQRPTDLVMPHDIEVAVTILFGVFGLLFALYAFYVSYRRRSWVPTLMLFGGLFTVLLEVPADIVMNVVHPRLGQINAYVSRGSAVPLYIVLAYFTYYSALPILLYDRIQRQDVTSRDWWMIVGVSTLIMLAAEAVFINLGLFVFYGEHPMRIGPMPLWYQAPNAASLIIPALVLYRLVPVLSGYRKLLILAIIPLTACAAHLGVSVPAFNVLGMQTERLPGWLIELSGWASVGFGVLMIWIGIQFATDRLSSVPSKAAPRYPDIQN